MRPDLFERAFQLARSGDHKTVTSIQKQLKREGFFAVEPQLAGAGIRKELRTAIAEAASTGAPRANDGASGLTCR